MVKTRHAKREAKPKDGLHQILSILHIDINAIVKEVAEDIKFMYSDACDHILEDRVDLKNMLAPCFEGRVMPTTPRKNYKPPVGFINRKPPQILEFEGDNELEIPCTSNHGVFLEGNGGNVDEKVLQPAVQETELVIEDRVNHTHIEVHMTEERSIVPVSSQTRTPIKTPEPLPRTIKLHTPAHLVNAIPATPSPAAPRLVKPFTRSKSAKTVKNTKTTEELQMKNEMALQRKAELQKEKAERQKYENEQRKRRVEENRKKKLADEAQKKDEHRKKHEALKKFQDEQRNTPKPTTPKPATPRTPGQKAVPPKRPKPESSIHRPKAMEIDEKTERMTRISEPIEKNLNSMVIEEAQNTNEQVVADETHVGDKENQVIPVTRQAQRLNQSAYEMTPEKVLMPSTDNDYNVADLSSNDETDNEDEPRKKVPGWAQKEQLRVHIASLKQRMSKEEINNHFGQVKPPRVLEIFGGPTKKTYRKLDETTLWDSPIQNPRPAPLHNLRSMN